MLDSLSDSGWERRKRDLSAGEFLAGFGWRGAPALVLSVRGGWGPTATGGAARRDDACVYLTLSGLDCRRCPPAPRVGARMCAQGKWRRNELELRERGGMMGGRGGMIRSFWMILGMRRTIYYMLMKITAAD